MALLWIIFTLILVIVFRNMHISMLIALGILAAWFFFSYIYPRIKYVLWSVVVGGVCAEIVWIGVEDWDFAHNKARIFIWLIKHYHVLFLPNQPLHSFIGLFPTWPPLRIDVPTPNYPTLAMIWNPEVFVLLVVFATLVFITSVPIWKDEEECRKREEMLQYQQYYPQYRQMQQPVIQQPVMEQSEGKKIPLGFQIPEKENEDKKKKV